MNQKATHRVRQLHDLQFRFVPQIIDLCPIQWYTAPNLYETQSPSTTRLFLRLGLGFEEYNLLSLIEVGNVTLTVYTPPEVACARTMPGAPADEAELKGPVLDGCCLYCEC